MLDRKKHWEKAYAGKEPNQHSWYQVRPDISLELIAASGISPDAALIDVGGGESTLVDALLQQNFSRVTVLDVAVSAMAHTRARLGQQADRVRWVEADITAFRSKERFALWHDRAVFHFLTDAEDQERYRETLYSCLLVGGDLILATFAMDGPTKCSGLDIVRYNPKTLQTVLGDGIELLTTRNERHVTPSGKEQSFLYGHFKRR